MAPLGYAYYIPEGTGYLHIRRLGEGSQGWTSLVQSVEDKKIYVRKKNRPGSGLVPEAEVGADNANLANVPWRPATNEVSLYRPHPLIPRLMDWTDYSPNRQVAPNGLNVETTTMIWQLCNGGDLAHFYDFFNMEDRRIPEQIIWRCFSQLLRTLEFLHRHCRPHIVHEDLGAGNVFLNWEADSRFPDFFIGDFGAAHTFPTGHSSAGHGGLDVIHNPEEITEELHSLGIVISEMIVTDDYDLTEHWDENLELMANNHNGIYSVELFQCLGHLNEFQQHLDQNPDQYYARLAHFRTFVDAQAMLWETHRPADVSHTRPNYRNEPLIFSSRSRLVASRPPPQGPWQIATVDSQTHDVLSVEHDVHW